MPDLYETLGVGRDADKAAIRGAYRKRAKGAHPDAGGSKEKFGALKLAHDVLTNDASRKVYDETGKIEDAPVDNALSDALQMVQMAIDHILTVCTKRGIDPVTVDMIGDATKFLKDRQEKLKEQTKEFAAGLAQTRKIASRFKAKKGKQDLFSGMMAGRISAFEQAKAHNTKEQEKIKRALSIIADHEFQYDLRSETYGGGMNFAQAFGNVFTS